MYLTVQLDDDDIDLTTLVLREGLGRVDKDLAVALPQLYQSLLTAEQDARDARVAF